MGRMLKKYDYDVITGEETIEEFTDAEWEEFRKTMLDNEDNPKCESC